MFFAAAFHTKSLQISGVRVDLQIWDTAGQEKFRSLTPMYYRECAAALVVYDLGKPETLETAEYWIKELKEKENPYCILLVGNKSDTVSNLAEATGAGRALADQMKLRCVLLLG
jgi:Ras-related protein Rab-5C